ncbi:MAG: hypothetical protein A2Y91_04365 [Chloroflexi bacterium RBG_13_54_8]|nr:MAG: hypothetical protein A2Y91_04365 [Chloroflexi bacterium RBG_13_54_8]
MGWQVTATTIKCDYVGDFAVVMVYPDKTAKCAFVNKHTKLKGGQKKLQGCKWPDCPLVSQFRERAFAM